MQQTIFFYNMNNYLKTNLFKRLLERKLFFIFFLAFVFRFLVLANIPYRVDGDASRFAVDGVQIIKQGLPFAGIGWEGQANGYFYLVGFFLHIFSNQLIGIRFLSAIGGFLGVIATYLFIRKLFTQQVACYAALFLTACPFDLVFSRNGMEVVWMTFFAPMILFLFLQESDFAVMISGFLTGVSQYFGPGNRLIPILLLVLLTLLLLHRKILWKKGFVKIIFWLLCFGIAYMPMIIYFVGHPADYSIRVNMVSIFQPGWLSSLLSSGKFIAYIMNCFFVFFLPVPSTPFWFYRTPYLDYFAIFFFIIGLVYGVFFIKKLSLQLLYMYLFSVIIIGGILTIDSPMPSRYIIAFPAIAGFIGYAIDIVIKLFHKKAQLFVIFFVGVLFLIGGLTSYFSHEEIDTWKYDINTQIATYAGRFLAKKDRNHKIYFLGTNNMFYNGVVTLRFLTGKEGVDIMQNENLAAMAFPQKSDFVILPERKKDLLILSQKYSRGFYREFRNPSGDLLFYLVER